MLPVQLILNLIIVTDACPKCSDTGNILIIITQEKDFTSLNITFIQLKVSPQKYLFKGFKLLKYLRDFIANHGFFLCRLQNIKQ